MSSAELQTSTEFLSEREAPSANPVAREAQLAWHGISAIPRRLGEAFDDQHIANTAANVAMSFGLTLALRAVTRSTTLADTAKAVVGPALTLAFVRDLFGHASAITSALRDNWYSAANWQQNRSTMEQHVGQFGADLAVGTMSSLLAERAARSYFSLKAPGANVLPELTQENIIANWQRHQHGDVVPYKMTSRLDGGARQLDLFLPPAYEFGTARKPGILIAVDGFGVGFGPLKNFKAPTVAEVGLANTRLDPTVNYIAAFPHARQFRVLPGLNVSTWFHEAGLVSRRGWFAPEVKTSDLQFMIDVHQKVIDLFGKNRITLVGFSSGGLLANEVAAKLTQKNVRAVISVASTVTGLEPPAVPGQFRLFVRDRMDPILPEWGGALGPSRLLSALGHKTILSSNPRAQVDYGLKPYADLDVRRYVTPMTGAIQQSFALADGTPVVSYALLNARAHSWPNSAANLTYETASPFLAKMKGLSRVPSFDLNSMVKEIVNGDLSRFKSPL